ncbi:MAG: NAD-dependent deacylase [Victivallaceae bacterium]|nr:NAD-dependent deacylase [Victivallaceae bacterium]
MSELLDLIKESRKCVVFTGAGVSTLSGIPDFRGTGGVYTKPWHGLSVEEILSIDCFRRHPEYFFEWSRQFVYCCRDFEPGVVHKVLAKLEETGLVDALFTQNIDILHQKAGSKKCFELHGSPARHHCLECGKSASFDEIAPVVMVGNVPKCSCGGVFKPDIVFYGESLPAGIFELGEEEFSRADLVLSLGSSLTVYPAAMLPECGAAHGAKLVIVNAQPTHLDDRAYRIYRDLGEVFGEIAREIGVLR